MEQFRKIDMLLNHMTNNDPKIKEELLDCIIGMKYTKNKIINIVGGKETGKSIFAKYITAVNKTRKLIPFIVVDSDFPFIDKNDSISYVKSICELLPYYGTIIILTNIPIVDYISYTENSSHYLKTIYIHDNVLTFHEKSYCFTGLLYQLQEGHWENNDENIEDFAKYLDNEFEKRTNRKISETQSNLRYIEEFDYFLPTIATIFDVNEIHIANKLFNQHIKQYDLNNILKENTERINKQKSLKVLDECIQYVKNINDDKAEELVKHFNEYFENKNKKKK